MIETLSLKGFIAGDKMTKEREQNLSGNSAFIELRQSVYSALETYSNVHRGSGHNSIVTTRLFDKAREIILEYLNLSKSSYTVIFCTPRRAERLKSQLDSTYFQVMSSVEVGLPLAVEAIAVKRRILKKCVLSETGGGTARLISRNWVVWAKLPDKFEAGTPSIINIITFAVALQLTKKYGADCFSQKSGIISTAADILYRDDLEDISGSELLEKLRDELIGKRIQIPTRDGLKPFVNLDNGASTPTFESVWKAVWQTWQQPIEVQKRIVQEVKSICTNALGASSEYDVIFTSNTTESINLVAESLSKETASGIEPVVINTILEHNSNELPWRSIPGCSVLKLSIDSDGFIDVKELENYLTEYNKDEVHGNKRVKIVAVSGASNVLGVYNKIDEICAVAHQYNACVLVDAAQLVAHRKIEMGKWGVDYLVFSAHKMYAPFGSGALVARKGLLNFNPEEMKLINTSGEENTGGIAAMGKAFLLLQRIGLGIVQKEEQALTADFLQGMQTIQGMKLFGIQDPKSTAFANKGGVIVFILKNALPHKTARLLALLGGIGVRSGCHCSHILVKHLHKIPAWAENFQKVMVSLLPIVELPGVVRVSLGIENTRDDIDRLIQALGEIAESSKSSANKGNPSHNNSKSQEQLKEFINKRVQKVYSFNLNND